MDKQEIREILKKKAKKITKLSDAILPDFDHDDIHTLRVEVKKLRAFLRLINTDINAREIKVTEKFKRLYHIAGAIRDAQLEQKRIAERGIILPLYSGNLDVNIQRQKGEWEKYYSKKITERLKEKMDNYYVEDLRSDTLSRFFNERIESMNEFSQKKVHSNNQIHAVRKQVKDMLYNAKYAEKKWEAGFEKIKAFSLTELDELSTAIGEYNDARIVFEHLSFFSSSTMTGEEKKAIANICEEEMDRLQTEKKKVLTGIKQFIKPGQGAIVK